MPHVNSISNWLPDLPQIAVYQVILPYQQVMSMETVHAQWRLRIGDVHDFLLVSCCRVRMRKDLGSIT
jgi:hypothetical protein